MIFFPFYEFFRYLKIIIFDEELQLVELHIFRFLCFWY